ncbi:class I SAM-dependent methyltransferase [Ferruginivarius sediminum]|uniref:Class I SAM-dependent methyltransferase n=1 Tax=Ferruginivarius sediminum TaxID=2661937 RepID=A0A369T8D1_9PROT|nr:class I SAM-dependent methyltransferase [Ferruginivarius sediminum]RDD61152.1 class I SAM-dependent methyltransferase [Ferruginivarius sediminum]
MANPLTRSAYMLGQAARIGAYFGQYWLSARVTRPVKPPRPIARSTPKTGQILADLRKLLRRDWENVEAGHYRVPHDLFAAPVDALRTAPQYFRDLQAVERRRHDRQSQEIFAARREDWDNFPRYYLQNFHYQTDGWLSRESARLYDHQVEVLFGGGADAMRRQALVPLASVLHERGVRRAKLLDMACGTGRFLTFVKDNYPKLHVTALDLSPDYLEEARDGLSPWRGVDFVQAPAERTGLPEATFDAVTCIYLFHELPAKIRGQVAAEAHRLLKPGGAMILLDSVQLGDNPDYDGLLEYFPVAFHEPYYAEYARSDLDALFTAAGFRVEATEVAYFSRVMTLRKPAD